MTSELERRNPAGRWLVTGVARTPTDGGLLRAHHLFSTLVERTGADAVEGIGGRAIAEALLRDRRRIGARLATADMLVTPRGWAVLRRLVRPMLADLHDHPVLQRDALGFSPSGGERRDMLRRFEALVRDFPRLVVPSESFAALCGLQPSAERVVVIPNGTDTDHVRPEPWPDDPTISLVSGAAPGRGIELLVDAVRLVRREVPATRLRLALVATGPVSSRPYLDELRRRLAHDSWIEISHVPYSEVSGFLGASSAIAIPHPPHAYYDAAVPIKLFDAMAAGRPVVSTPRSETARLLREHDAGIVAASDSANDFAEALVSALSDEPEARRLGANARRAAVERYDWRVLSRRLADSVLDASEGLR